MESNIKKSSEIPFESQKYIIAQYLQSLNGTRVMKLAYSNRKFCPENNETIPILISFLVTEQRSKT